MICERKPLLVHSPVVGYMRDVLLKIVTKEKGRGRETHDFFLSLDAGINLRNTSRGIIIDGLDIALSDYSEWLLGGELSRSKSNSAL